MDFNLIIGITGFALMLIMVLFGVPIFVAMLIPSLIGFWLIGGSAFALEQFTASTYNLSADYTWTVISMFLLMGMLAADSGMAEKCFEVASKWVPKIRGALLMTVVIANGIFGAVNGTPTASNAVFTKIVLPQIDKYKMDMGFSLSTISAAGVLGALIPPSTIIIILCILANVSIGQALVSGIVPAFLTIIVFCILIWTIGMIKPRDIPKIEIEVTFKERLSSLKFLFPVVVLFLLMVGGIYAGIYPPSVGGAIGAFCMLIYTLIIKMGKQKTWASFKEAVIINAQVFPMIFAGLIFGRFIALSNLTNVFNDFIIGMDVHAYIIIAILMIFYILMGLVGEVMPILIITIPIVFPLLTSIGFDPLVILVIIIFMVSLGALTPPIGISIFVIGSIANINPMIIFRKIWPYFFAQIAICWIIVIFPQIVTWLPNLLYS